MSLEPSLLEILACPLCKTNVELSEHRLVCTRCGRRYRIEDGIPIMMLEEAELPPPDWKPRGSDSRP